MRKSSIPRDVSDAIQGLRRTLEANVDSGMLGSHVGINRCQTKQSLTRMSFGAPTVMLPVLGTKTVIAEDHEYVCKPGELLMLPDGLSFDVENAPDRQSARYLGIAVRFDVETLALFTQLYGKQFDSWDIVPKWQVVGRANLIAALSSWISWMSQFSTETTQIRHRMVELLLLFSQQGIVGNLILQKHKSWKHRLKELLKLDPARNWRIADVCKRLGVSESTLRRHLRHEEIGFRDLLGEVRLEHGMGLVMETDMLISQISLASGYQSQSRFSERFKLRFSMSPKELRNTRNAPSTTEKVIALRTSRR